MLLEEFNFQLPAELIAQHPVYPRHDSKMLVIGNENLFKDQITSNLDQYIPDNSLLIFNDSKVIPAKFHNDEIEFNLHQNMGSGIWNAFAKKTRKLKLFQKIAIASDCLIEILAINGGEITIKFDYQHGDDFAAIFRYGQMPLPPYIKRDNIADENDLRDYQNIFAKNDGSVAAPTAGLHFTEELFAKLKSRNIKHCFVTLHVGAGTFLPVKTNNIDDHKMHYESGFISQESKDLINQSKSEGKKIICVGTTSLRFLEASCDDLGVVNKATVNTNLFIRPGYKFKIADYLLTNFHLPCSTLFILVSSFAGIKKMKAAYEHAITNNYRFYSYGDCCLISRQNND